MNIKEARSHSADFDAVQHSEHSESLPVYITDDADEARRLTAVFDKSDSRTIGRVSAKPCEHGTRFEHRGDALQHRAAYDVLIAYLTGVGDGQAMAMDIIERGGKRL